MAWSSEVCPYGRSAASGPLKVIWPLSIPRFISTNPASAASEKPAWAKAAARSAFGTEWRRCHAQAGATGTRPRPPEKTPRDRQGRRSAGHATPPVEGWPPWNRRPRSPPSEMCAEVAQERSQSPSGHRLPDHRLPILDEVNGPEEQDRHRHAAQGLLQAAVHRDPADAVIFAHPNPGQGNDARNRGAAKRRFGRFRNDDRPLEQIVATILWRLTVTNLPCASRLAPRINPPLPAGSGCTVPKPTAICPPPVRRRNERERTGRLHLEQ